MAMSQVNQPFDPLAEAEKLRKAMKGLGTDEAAIIAVLSCRPSHQRVEIAKAYKTSYGKDLISALKSEISGDFLDTCTGLCFYLCEYDAKCLRRAVKGAGTDEQTVIDILTTRNNQQLQAIKAAYSNLFQRNLESDIRSDVSGYFSRVLISLLTANRDETVDPDPQIVARDVDALFQAGENRFGTEESVFNRVLCARSFQHVAAVATEYAKRHNKSLIDVIKSETSGSYCDCLVSIVSFAANPCSHFASALHSSMRGIGTNDKRLQQLIITQCEGDFAAIKASFHHQFGCSLEQMIKGDTSGDYRKLLLALVVG